MSTTTTAPTTPTKEAPISLTPNAIAKVRGIMAQQNPAPAGLRVGVVGGGCSGGLHPKSETRDEGAQLH
jgi:Fe-S cluster assembly iron-binding protein IscA